MSKLKNPLKRMLGFCLAFLFVTTSCLTVADISANALVESVNGSDSLVRTSLSEIKSVLTSKSYADYLEENDLVFENAKSSIDVDITKYDSDETTATVAVDNGEKYGIDGKVLLMGDDGKVSFKVNVPADAYYCIEFGYWTGNVVIQNNDGEVVCEGKSTDIERIILVDGAVPYKEARSISLTRSWTDVYNVVDSSNGYKAVYEKGENGKQEKVTYNTFDSRFIDSVRDQSKNVRLFQRDNAGNEMKPNKELYPLWYTECLRDSAGYYAEPLRFALTKGEHIITFSTIREPVAINSFRLCPAETLPTYAEYISSHDAAGAKDYTGKDAVKIQGEYSSLTSDKTIYQLNDRTSAISEPQDAALQRLNSIGGDKWTYVGQWVEYNIEVPEDGYYNIVLRYKQSIMEGMYVSRKIYINGEVPFAEASNLRFNYDDAWQTGGMYDGKTEIDGKSFKFYLNKGVNTIRYEVVLGDMAEILSSVENTLTNCNAYYRKILMLTGPDPDEYRDYSFEKIMPDVLKGLKKSAQELKDVSKRLTEVTGVRGSNNGTLERVATTIEEMGLHPNKIAALLSQMKDYLAALGSWLTDTQSQPLEIDYIRVQAVNSKLPKAEAGFWTKLVNEVKKFFVSFVADYNSISSTSNMSEEELKAIEKAGIEVWTASSRDQAQIIKKLVDDDFMEKYNVPVNVKLVIGSTLLPATLAGTGPDIAMNIDQSTPVNYAIRSAVYALNTNDPSRGYNFNDFSKFETNPVYKQAIESGYVDTFDETFARFPAAAKTPITLYGETYGIPVTMSFPMLFYRKDIFVEMGLNVPNTWDQFKEVISSLQANNLNIGFPTGTGGSMILMYQIGEPLYDMGNYDYYLENYPDIFGYDEATGSYTKNVYTDEEGNVIPKTDGMTINLDSNESLSAFKKVCQYFTMYDFPVSYTLADRFRDGTMPLAVADYSGTYNTLIVFAPEIAGLWEFTPLPGTVLEDGKTIDNTTVASVSTMILMRSVNDDNAFTAWIFMQWFTSAEVQSAFGNEMEALLGPSAKQATANIEALTTMSWSKDEMDNLMAQFNAVECTPEFPGSYIIGRYTNFAFLDVYNNNEDPVTEMLSYIVDINNELSRKRKEFGLPTQDDIRAADSAKENK